MQFRTIGRTDVSLSVVGLGTVHLQMLPEQQAVDTLVSGFAQGVNWVHTAPDYGGVDPLIVEAIARSKRPVMVAQGSPGRNEDLPAHFEHALHIHRTRRLALYGLGGIEDLEWHGENVWGGGGMVEYLKRQKADGRLGGIFCSTHESADYVVRLIESGAFDAIMLAWNPLGFHQQSHLYARVKRGRGFEDLTEYRTRVFPLAAERGVSLLIMKPFAGGLLCRSRALPPHDWLAGSAEPLPAADVLRLILEAPGVCAVVPGAASPEEAAENARAGHGPLSVSTLGRARIERTVASMRTMLCSRCGKCEGTCSRELSIPGMFRDAYIWSARNETTGADPTENYFDLHPDPVLACTTCSNQSCACPQGLPVPLALGRVHDTMQTLIRHDQHPGPSSGFEAHTSSGPYRVHVLTREVPVRLPAGSSGTVRFLVGNAGEDRWLASQHTPDQTAAVGIAVVVENAIRTVVPLRNTVWPGARSQIAFSLDAPDRTGNHRLSFALLPLQSRDLAEGSVFHSSVVVVDPLPPRRLRGRIGHWLRRAGLRPDGALAAGTGEGRGDEDVGAEGRVARGAEYLDHSFPGWLKAGVTCGVRLRMRNSGSLVWSAAATDGTRVEAHLYVDDVLLLVLPLPHGDVPPGGEVNWHFAFRAPDAPGSHRVQVYLTHQAGPTFASDGVAPWVIDVQVVRAPLTETVRLVELERKHNPWHYDPLLGIPESRDGRPFPLFIARGKGCRVWDVEGHEFLDYTMGWGSTILGHADDRIQAAVREMVDTTGAVLPFPHPVEMEVSRRLLDWFPGNDMVVFGKNGSDMCTIASRLARVITRKRVILSCGFHGWQDFGLDYFTFEDCGIPDRPGRVLHKFPFNDRARFLELYEHHRHDLAAVMIEPAGPLIDDEAGLGGEPEPEFLHTVADAARQAGALLIFDEIITGFRYRHGSVQQATGVVPDLTCLGKALASGMPLAALVGPYRVFIPHFHKAHFNATFKSEVYSLAAAHRALGIYRDSPVVDHLWRYGEQLRAAVHDVCRQMDVPAEMTGPPFRMLLVFRHADPARRQLMRTLLLQELMKEGVITVSGMVLPSAAHDDGVLRRTVEAYGRALEVVAHAGRTNTLHQHIELGTV